MDWILSLDLGLFRFINLSLSNWLFDRLMPFFSNNSLFVPAVVVLAVFLVWKGGVRGRVCVLMLLVTLWLGDSWICSTLKEAIGRPRPFDVVPDINLLIGKGKTCSMPSSHAANWFSAAMVAFIFYRRSWRYMVPMALLVSFSRIYNGVHFPSDVLVGAILGAGYGAAFVFGLDWLWQSMGQRWFPLWWERLPSLANPELRPAKSTGSTESQWLHLGYALILILLVGQWIYLGSGKIELSEDEAYQWLWSKHLALSYYSKPPIIAWLQWLGTHIFGNTELGVRFCSPMIAAALSLLVLRFVSQHANARLGFLSVLIINATPLLAVGATLMTVDPPLILFWMLAMFAGWTTIESSLSPRQKDQGSTDSRPTKSNVLWWMIAGLCLGLSFLSKYAALYQIVCWALFFLLCKPARAHLRTPGPYLALLVMALCTIPVLIWNAQHNWATVQHVGDNAGLDGTWRPTAKYLMDFIAIEALLLNPVFFVAMLWANFAFWKTHRQNPLHLFLFCMGAPVFFGYLLFTGYKRVFPNWIAPAVLPMFLLMILYWHSRWQSGSRAVKNWAIGGIALGLVVVVLGHETNLIRALTDHSLPAQIDPLRRVRLWRKSAVVVEEARRLLEGEGRPAFIIGNHYGITGEISFYLPEARAAAERKQPLVYCLTTTEPRSQFFFWPEYQYREHRRGQNAIFVREIALDGNGHPAPARLLDEFASVTDLGVRDIEYKDGRVLRRLQLFACRDLK